MSQVRSALILGVHSFADRHRKTGIQHIAEGLARRGVAVEYVSASSSPLDLAGAERRGRLARVWPRLGRSPVAEPIPGLKEYAFPSLLPVHRLFLRSEGLLRAVRFPAASWFAAREYDLCVHDVSPTMAYLPLVRSRRHVLRLNDSPRGLESLPLPLVRALEARLTGGFYQRVWAVSDLLAAYSIGAAPTTPADTIPNGFDASQFAGSAVPAREPGRRAVYLGSQVPWLDLDLLKKAAALLPDWEFCCLGAGFERERDRANLRFLPPIPHDRVAEALTGFDVGLLPYLEDRAHMACVRRPLKFYEYVAAGLGVACADVGGLRDGMGGWAQYGRTPEEFARAVVESVPAARAIGMERRERFFRDNGWQGRIDRMLESLA